MTYAGSQLESKAYLAVELSDVGNEHSVPVCRDD